MCANLKINYGAVDIMNYSELLELIKIGEGYTIEFKEKLSDTIAKDICAFTNSSGGKIILGIDDKNNEVKGFKLANEIRSRMQNYARNIDPPLIIDVEQNNDLVVIYVPEGKEKPYFVNGKCYIRQGANSQQLSRDEIRNFFQKTNMIRFDRKLNSDFNLDEDFNKDAFEKFVDEAKIDKTLSKEHILKNLNLIKDNKLTNTGVLFFSNSTKRFFLNSVITSVLYQGYERIDVLDREDLELDFISNLEGAIKFLLSNLRIKSVIKGLKRCDVPEIPTEILREIVLNAMVHRDYYSEGRIFIEIFKNRVEISNPGGLLFDKKLLGKKSLNRNPLIADLVYRLGLVEKIGSGINRIKRILGGNVSFEDENDGFRVVIKREETITEKYTEGSEKSSEKSSEKILQLIKENPKITIKELAGRLNLSTRAIEKTIFNLKEKSALKRVGPKKGGYWEVLDEKE